MYLQLMSSRLSHMKGEDINLMCRTTPAMINGIQYDKPVNCVDKVRPFYLELAELSILPQRFSGVYGKWEVKDPKCSR